MPEDTHDFLKTDHKSLLTKKLFNIKDFFWDVLSSDPENTQHWESLGPDEARALGQKICSKSIVKFVASPGKKNTQSSHKAEKMKE